jgi:hypothetical protein
MQTSNYDRDNVHKIIITHKKVNSKEELITYPQFNTLEKYYKYIYNKVNVSFRTYEK